MVYKKYISRAGKKFGPYYFKSVRTKDGKVKSVYLGTSDPTKRNTSFFTLFFLVALLFLFGFLGMFAYQGFDVVEISDIESGSEGVAGLSGEGQLEEPAQEELKEEKLPEDDSEEEIFEEEPSFENSLEDEGIGGVKQNISTEINDSTFEHNESTDLNETTPEDNESTFDENISSHVKNDSVLNLSLDEVVEIVNETLIEEVSLKNLGVVINQPVVWEKKVKLKNRIDLYDVELPEDVFDIEYYEIGYDEDFVEKGKEKESENLITGNVVFNFFKDVFRTTGEVVYELDENKLSIKNPSKEFLIKYSTPGPESKEVELGNERKKVFVSGKEFENVLVYTYLDNVPKESIDLYILEKEGRLEREFETKDLDEDGLIDYIEWIIPVLDKQKEFEIEIIILNVQSYPYVGGNWTVRFNTTGTANLSIKPFNGTTWDIKEKNDLDLQFLDLKCGNESVGYLWENGSVFVENYSCLETGIEISKVLTDAKHYLKFEFGNQIAYAYNDVLSCGQAISGTVIMENDITNCAANGLSLATNTVLDCDGHIIDGDNVDDSNWGIWIAYNKHGITVKNCHIKQFAMGGFNWGNNNLWLNNTFTELYDYGIKSQTSSNVSFVNNTFKNYQGSGSLLGIDFKNTNGGLVDGNTFYNITGGAGIRASSSTRSYGLNFSNNNISSNRWGIYVTYLYDIIVKNNIIYDNTDHGMLLSYGGNWTITNNTIYTTDSSQDYGIDFGLNFQNSTMVDNRIENHTSQTASAAFYSVQSTSRNNIFDNNTLKGNKYGFYLYPNGPFNNITNNNIISSTTTGVYARSLNDISLINNSVGSCGTYCLYAHTIDGLIVNNFTGAGSSSYALYVHETDNFNLTSANFDSNSNCMYMSRSLYGHIVNSSCNAAGTYGGLTYHSESNTFNNVSITAATALYMSNLTYNTFINSIVSGSSLNFRMANGERDENNTLLNTSSGNIQWDRGWNSFEVKWFLDVKTNLSTDNSNLSDSVVQGYNNTGGSKPKFKSNNLVFNLTTDINGNIVRQNLTERLINRTHGNYGYKTNYTIVVNHSSYDGQFKEVNLTSDKSIFFEFGTANSAPNNPSPILNTTDGSNSPIVDLNCSATITDPDSDKMNVTVRWYRSNDYIVEGNFTNSTNSYISGTLFNRSLDSGNTAEGDSWHCAMRLNDSLAGSEWGNSSEFTLKEFNNTYYVSKNGDDTNAGTSWKDAWKTINYAENTAGANAIIYVGDGLYREQSYASNYLLIMDKNVQNRTFISYNKSQAVIQANTSASSIVIRFITGANNVTFKGFVIDGNNTEDGIWADQGTGVINLYNNTFVNTTSYGIAMYDYGGSPGPRHNWHIEDNVFNNTGTGISGYDSSNVTIKNNNFTYKLTSTHIKYYGPSPNNTIIQGNYFENSSSSCIEVNNIGSNWQIKDNQFGNQNDYINRYGITINNSQNLLIKNNTFWHGNFSGAWVSIHASANNNGGLKIQNNVWGNDTRFLNMSTGSTNGYAIRVINVSNSLFENNSFYISDGVPIHIKGAGNGPNKNMTIRNNAIDHNVSAISVPAGYSIYVGEDTVTNFQGDMNDTIIENNTIRMARVHTSKHPLFTASTFNTTIRYNRVIGGGYGILSKHETLYRAYNNTMENQTNFEGFVTRAGHNTTIYNNTFFCPNYNRTESPMAIVAKNAKYENPRNVTNLQVYNNRIYVHNQSYIYGFSDNGTNFSNTNFTTHDNIIILNNSNQNVSWENNTGIRYNFTEQQKKYNLDYNSIFSATEEIPWVLNRTNTTGYTTVDINWTSQESSNASLNYGGTVSLGTTYGNLSLGLFHSFNLSGLSEGTIYYYNLTSCDYENNCNETGTYNFTTGTSNVAPNTPSPLLNATGGPTNYTTQNLNCSATITDPDSNKLNVSVRWYNNSVLWLSQDYNDSYASGTLFNATLNSSNTTKWEVWNCSIRLHDGTIFGGWGNSSNITILNTIPSAYTNVLLNTTSDSNTNYTDENLTVYFDTYVDNDGDGIYNITDWRLNGNSSAVLNAPFDSNESSIALNIIKDYSTFGNNGTLQQWEGGSSLNYPVWINSGAKGGAYSLNPNESVRPYINFSHTDSLNITKELTVEIWVNKSKDLDYQSFVMKGSGAAEGTAGHRNSFLLRAWTSGDVQFRILGATAADQAYSATTSGGVSVGGWHHVVGVYDRQNISLYIDGVRTEGEEYTGNIRDSSIDVLVGRDTYYPGRMFNGSVDELRIYNESLSSEQILANYQAGLANHSPMRILSNGTVKTHNWSVAITPNDLEEDGPVTLSNPLLILNKPPNQVVLDSPANLNITVDRTETSNWSIPNDADGDSLTYLLELDDSDAFSEPIIINVSPATNEYTILSDLDLDLSYWWRVRANDSSDLGVWSDPYNFTVQSLLAVSLINESPNFGRLYTGDMDNTTDESPTPIVVKNDGNALINISVNATTLFDAVAMDTSYYQFRIDNSSEETAFDWLNSFVTWTNMATAQVIAIDSLKYQDTNDTAQCEILIELPSDEPAGNKTSYILFESSLTE